MYGSSTAQGHGDASGGWPVHLQHDLRGSHGCYYEVVNHGFRHTFATDALEHLPHDIARFHKPRRQLGLEPGRLFGIFQFGSDSGYLNEAERTKYVEPEPFKKTLRAIGSLCVEQLSGPPILATMPPLVGELVDRNRVTGLNLEGRAEYNQYVREIASENGYPLADVEYAFAKERANESDARYLYADDGFHPDRLGHLLIKATILPLAERLLE